MANGIGGGQAKGKPYCTEGVNKTMRVDNIRQGGYDGNGKFLLRVLFRFITDNMGLFLMILLTMEQDP